MSVMRIPSALSNWVPYLKHDFQPLDFDADQADVIQEIVLPGELSGLGQEGIEKGFSVLEGTVLDQGEKLRIVQRQILAFAEIAEAVGVKQKKIAGFDRIFLGRINRILRHAQGKLRLELVVAHGSHAVFRPANMERVGMTGVGESHRPGDRIDHQIESRHEHRSRKRFEEVAQSKIEFA